MTRRFLAYSRFPWHTQRMTDTVPTNPIFSDFATEQVLTTFLEHMPLIGIGLDTQGVITYANPYFLTVTGFTREEVIGKNWFKTFIPETQKTMISSAFADILAKESYTRVENAILTKSGELRQISWTNALMKDTSGKLLGTLSIGMDISNLKNAEQFLLENEERFRILSEMAQEGIAIHDHGIILLSNKKLSEMSGYTDAELVGKQVLDFFLPESQEIMKKHIDQEIEGCYKATGKKRDGSTIPVEICGKMAEYHGRRVRVTTIRELTEADKAL